MFIRLIIVKKINLARTAITTAATLTLLGTTAPMPALADDTPTAPPAVTTGALFNDPTSTDKAQRNAIHDHLVRLTDGAVPGSTIEISTFLFYSPTLSQHLVAAHLRGVHVQVLLDGKYANDTNLAYTTLATGLANKPADSGNSWVRVCDAEKACLAQDPEPNSSYQQVNHNKFYLFSQTTGSATATTVVRNVVVQSSSNMTSNDFNKFWNDALTVTENAELYEGYDAYFQEQVAAQAGFKPRLSDVLMDKQAGRAKAYFFPRATTGPGGGPNDVILNILNTVDNPVPGSQVCHGNDAGYGLEGRTVIRIAMGGFNRPEVAKKLAELDQAGCYVDLVYGSLAGDGEAEAILKTSKPPYNGVAMHELQATPEGTGTTSHTKYLLIEGTYNGKKNQKIVFTGSHTYTNYALIGNDEALLKWDDSNSDPTQTTVFDAYRENFRTQRAVADAQSAQPYPPRVCTVNGGSSTRK
ncbi:phospholipase D-like domain-containing protein [Streptomyces sp. NPDC099050]|uniref:phospholipase D-like domain-containing protein n=1 Tax=Streptomyces sp. NPDC099050 TaxID=3366100 RepID=UPI00382D945D